MLGSMFGGSSIPPSAAPFSMHDSSRSSSNHAEKRKFKRPNGKSSKTTSNNGSKGKLIKKMVPTLSQDQNEIIGTLFDGNPAILGFQQPTKPAERELPRYLIRQAPILKPVPIVQDEWDKKNQERMLQLEDNISDVTTLWETLKKMRDEEREVMEEKGLVDKADQAKDLTEAIIFQGTCQDMCPIFERARRSVENNVVRYEKANPSDKKVDRGKALKVFARPAAAAAPPLPSDVRPPHVLLGTLDYIVDEIVPLLPDCEAFLWDRMRSIRQDFTYQNYSGPEAIDCNERIVRIHLLILHQMAKTDITFSVQQELEQLHKAIITLCEIYDEVRDQGGQCPNEAEFRAYALLSKIRDPEYDKMAQDLPNDIFNDELMQLAITFRRILANSNHVERGVVVTENCMNLYDRFFQLIQSDKVPFLMSSFLQVYLNEIRFYAFKSLSLAVTRKGGNLPYQYFIEHFLFRDANDLETFCRYYSIDFGDGKILLKSLTGTSHFLAETQPMRKNWVSCVEQKLQRNTTTALINNRKHNVDTIPSNKRSLLDNVSQLEESQLTQYNQNFAGTSGAKETLPISANRPFSFQTSTSLITEKNATANGNQPFMFGTPSQPKTDVKKAPNDVSLEGVKLGQAAPFGKTDEFVKKQALQQKLEEQKQKFNMQKQLDEKARLLNEKQGLEKQNEEKLRRQLELEKVQQAAIQRRNEIVNETSSNIFTTLMEQQLEKTIKNEIQKRQANALHIENLSRDLFRSFIHEQIYFVFLEVRADIFKKKIITMHVMKKWRSKFNKILKLKKIKQQKQEEALRLSKELGVGKRVHSLRSTTKKNKYLDANSTFEASSFIKSGTMNYSTPLHLEENHFTTPVRNNSNVWSPLDLKEVYFNELLSRLQGILKDSKPQSKDIKSQIDIVLYSKTWECISGQWLLSKFHLAKDSTYTIDSPILNAGFIRLTNDYKTDSFNNVNLVLFNSGVTDSDIFDLDMKLQKDGERLIEVICGVAFNTNYKFKLIIIYWESIENPKSTTEIKQLLKVHKILKRFGDIMYGIEVVKIVGSNPEALVANGLANAAHDFQFELTDRGLYNETRKRRSLLGVGMDTVREPSADIDEKMQLMLQQDKDKSISSIKEKSAYAYLKNHAMASPRARYKKLPVLLSESHKPKYKTPIPLANSRHSSITSADVSNPSHLVKKIKPSRTQIPPHNTSGNFGTPSQPRSLLNHTAVLTTPHLAGIGSHNASASSNVANISVHSDFTTPSATSAPPKPMARSFSISEHPTQPDHTKSKRMPRSVPGDIPPSIKELQNLIASVKRNLQDHQ